MADTLTGFEEYLRFEQNRSALTVEAYTRDVRDFLAFLQPMEGGTVDPAAVPQSDVRAWIVANSRQGASPATLRRKTQSLRSFFRWLMKQGLRRDNPAEEIPLPKLPKHLPTFVRTADMEALLGTKDRGEERGTRDEKVRDIRNKFIVEMLYSTGMREAELIGLNDSDINEARMEIRVIGKRRKERILPLPQPLLDNIRAWQRVRDAEYGPIDGDSPLLRTRHGRISTKEVYNIVRSELSGVDTARRSPHTLRHTFATAMLGGGADLNDVKDLLGHTSIATTQIYTHVSFQDIKKAYEGAHPRSSGTPLGTRNKGQGTENRGEGRGARSEINLEFKKKGEE